MDVFIEMYVLLPIEKNVCFIDDLVKLYFSWERFVQNYEDW